MTEKELRKLGRAELLELLLEQAREFEALEQRLNAAEAALQSQQLQLETCGSIAEASLNLNGVFEAAQAAAEQYLENVRRLSGQQEQICARMEEESKKKARALLLKTEERCRAREREADAYWDSISDKLQKFYDDHEGLYQLLQHSMRKPEGNKSE